MDTERIETALGMFSSAGQWRMFLDEEHSF
jgi:hypothetical protein